MAATTDTIPLTPVQRFWRLLRPDRKDIGHIYMYAVLIGVVSLAGPLGVQAIINLIAGGEFNASLVVLALVVTLSFIFVGVLKVMQKIIAEAIQRRLFARAALEFAYRLPRIRLEAFKDSYPPELVNRFFDTVNVQKGLPKILLDFSGAIMQIIFGLLLVTFYNTFFGIMGIVMIALLLILIRVLFNNSLATSLSESKYKYATASWLEDVARANNTFKLAGGARLAMRRTDELVSKYLDFRSAHFRLLLWHFSGIIAIQAFVTLTFLLLGGYLVINNQINIGQFVAAELVILSIISNAEKVVYSFETVYDTLTGVEKIATVTDLPLEVGGKMKFPELDTGQGMTVEITNLSFVYPRSGDTALESLDLEIASNERLCIAGFNRSGRTTLIQLLAGLRLDFKGRLLFNSTPIANYSLDTLRQAIGDFTPQEEIIPANITDNICLGHPDVSFSDIQWALLMSGLKGWVAEQPDGYETVLVAEGLDLPRSVRTRLLIARAIVRRPRLLVIGGLLEHLEPDLRDLIFTNLIDRKNPWTLVITSNDPRIAKLCDRVAVLRRGKLIGLDVPSVALRNSAIRGVWTSDPNNLA
ncbi:MAG: peptidase domain-containing ABC transporter [Saprospiraceae bacterium]